jgi:hypothetical protein
MDLATQRLMSGAAGAGKDKLYIDDVFSNYLYDLSYSGDNAPTVTVDNGIDTSEGALTITKLRDNSSHWSVFDTERGNSKMLRANTDDVEENIVSARNAAFTFQSSGFQITTTSGEGFNSGNESGKHLSYTFRRAPGFFDIVTYTGTGSSVLTLSHNLGSVPGAIWIKRRDGAGSHWICYHTSLGKTKYIELNRNQAAADDTGDYIWNDTAPTATHFTIGAGHDSVNANTNNYVAYLFANNDQQYGEEGNSSVIKCGSYTSNNGGALEVDLGFEPQFLLVKNSAGRNANWTILDVMRGMSVATPEDHKVAVLSGDYAEQDVDEVCSPVPTSRGFKMAARSGGYAEYNFSTDEIIYIAIRRSDGYVGKPLELGTSVFGLARGAGNPSFPCFVTGFPVDFLLQREFASAAAWTTGARLTGAEYMFANTTDAGADTNYDWGSNTGAVLDRNSDWQGWLWKRHAGFDVVAYEGNGTSGTARNHSLNKTPEMIWCKDRNNAYTNWMVYHKGLNGGTDPEDRFIYLNQSDAELNNSSRWGTLPTSSVFYTGSDSSTNGNGQPYIAMLFASVDGISKVGSYTGNGNASSGVTITTGFQPRFYIIKRADGTGPWYVVDSLRGMSNSGDEKILKLNSSDAQVSDNIGDTSSTGFTITSTHDTLNGNGDKYIYYAHS